MTKIEAIDTLKRKREECVERAQKYVRVRDDRRAAYQDGYGDALQVAIQMLEALP